MTFENSLGPTVLKLTGTLSCAALLIAISETAFSRNLNPGEVETVSVGATPEAWFIPATATLNLNGGDALNIVVGGGTLNAISANTAQIEASNALVTLDGASVTGSNFDTALSLTDSSAVVSGSTLSSDGRAMSLTRDLNVPFGSTATVSGSTLTGGFSGAAVTSLSTLNLVDSRVKGPTQTVLASNFTAAMPTSVPARSSENWMGSSLARILS